MPTDPVVLSYGRTPPPGWRRVARWTLRVLCIAGLIVAASWGTYTVWQAWGRYRFQSNWIAATAALTQNPLPPGTILIDPAAGPVTYMKPYTTPNGHGVWRSPTIPTAPLHETELRRMGRFNSLSAHPFASDLQTGHGKTFVWSHIDLLYADGASKKMSLLVMDEPMVLGTFPFYRYTIRGYLLGLRIMPSEG